MTLSGSEAMSAKVALIACMRILLIRLNTMLRDGTEWR
jgi:transposase